MCNEYCCIKCFADDWMIDYIKGNGTVIKKCSFCNAIKVKAITTKSFADIVSPVIGLYVPVTSFMNLDHLKEIDHSKNMIWDKLTDQWGVFDDPFVGQAILESIFQDDPRNGVEYGFMNEAVEIQHEWCGWEDEETNYGESLWERFCSEIKTKNRFNPRSFNAEVFDKTLEANEVELRSGKEMFRSRTQNSNKVLLKKEMGAPPPELSKYGRMNPQGIPYLYMAEDEDTCVAEVRPDLGATLSVGIFKLKQKCRMVNISDGRIGSPFKWGDDLVRMYFNKNFLKAFASDVSKSVLASNSYIEYLPTQYVSEYIKNKGYDGVIYKSSQTQKMNYTFFDPEIATCKRVYSVGITSLNYARIYL